MQVRGIVFERLEEARKLLEQSSDSLNRSSRNDAIYQLAYAKERLSSAKSWQRFLPSYTTTKTQPQQLREGCVARLQEAEEHIQYLEIYLPGVLQGKEELGPVYSYMRQADYPSCIYRASIAKAKANAMLSALSNGQNLTTLISKKIEAARESLARQTAKGEFPIVSYSYYEYAGSLANTDQPSALLFAEYALELSNLDVYLKDSQAERSNQPQRQQKREKTASAAVAAAIAGFLAGIIVALTAAALLSKAKSKKKRRLIIRRR
jgi:predicted S18 family serine protease